MTRIIALVTLLIVLTYSTIAAVTVPGSYLVVAGPGPKIETVDFSGCVGTFTSMTVGPDDRPRVSYLDCSDRNLRYANLTASGWYTETVDNSGEIDGTTSLATDTGGNPHIAYRDSSLRSLKYAVRTEKGWKIEIVDGETEAGDHFAISLNSSGAPRIAFYDAANFELNYAERTEAGWEIETVDTSGKVGSHSSLKLDTEDVPRVAYRDKTNRSLKYASKTDAGWFNETVDAGGDVGTWPDIDLDPNGVPHIAYYDEKNKTLRYAVRNKAANASRDGPWEVRTIDDSPSVGSYASLAIGTRGWPHIAYYDYANADLKYAYLSQDGWEVFPVDTGGQVGEFAGLATGKDGRVHISYFDRTNRDLRYAAIGPHSNDPPTSPVSVYPNLTTKTEPTISWEGARDPDGDILRYYVRIGTEKNGNDVLPWSFTGTRAFHNVTQPMSPGTYHVGVKAFDGIVSSGILRETLTIQPLEAYTEAVSLDKPADVGVDSMVLRWTAVDDTNFSKYEVHRSISPDIIPNTHTLVKGITNSSVTECHISGLTPATTYYFMVRVKYSHGVITNSNEVNATTMDPAALNEPPEATPSAFPLYGHPPLTVTFTGSGKDEDGYIAMYEWDLGGEENVTDRITHRTFHKAGTYKVTLTVTDNKGGVATAELTIEVIPEPVSPIRLSRVEINSNITSVVLNESDSTTFTAKGFAEDGKEIRGMTFAWFLEGKIGNIDDKGTFVAIHAGEGKVHVVGTYNGSERTDSIRVVVKGEERATEDEGISDLDVLVVMAVALAILIAVLCVVIIVNIRRRKRTLEDEGEPYIMEERL